VPPTGVIINNPLGSLDQRRRVITRVRDGINHTRKGQTIMFATYDFDRKDLADALIRAHRRGVNVQMVLNDNFQTPQEFRLQGIMGKNVNKSSFVKFCTGSCRAKRGNLHMKMYAFTGTGAATDVIMDSSANLTNAAPSHQWNDEVTIVGNHRLFQAWTKVFNQLKRDKPVVHRRITYTSRSLDVAFHRTATGATVAAPVDSGRTVVTRVGRAQTGAKDPVMAELNKIGCKTGGKYGTDGHTTVRLMEYAWYGARGIPLARKVASLARQGCNVRAIMSHSDKSVENILGSAHIPMRDATWWYGEKLSTDGHTITYGSRQYSHLKVLAINGRYGKKNMRTVFTGSENWDNVSYLNDEVTLQLVGDSTYYPYLNMFNHQWTTGATHAIGLEPTSPAPMEHPNIDAQPTAGPVTVPDPGN
jgi:phosphatidylserine/phosphatidylglycerophosphate/cardiolipin synthase-like enzyme